MGREGFEPPKDEPSDLQSDCFSHLHIYPLVDHVGIEPTAATTHIKGNWFTASRVEHDPFDLALAVPSQLQRIQLSNNKFRELASSQGQGI